PPDRGALLGIPAQTCNRAIRSRSALVVVDVATLLHLDQASSRLQPDVVTRFRTALLEHEGSQLPALLRSFGGDDRVLCMAVTPSPSSTMNRVGDEVTPLVMATGPANRLLPSGIGTPVYPVAM